MPTSNVWAPRRLMWVAEDPPISARRTRGRDGLMPSQSLRRRNMARTPDQPGRSYTNTPFRPDEPLVDIARYWPR